MKIIMKSLLLSYKCPICNLKFLSFKENCKRCDCDIYKLVKIQYQAFRLKQKKNINLREVSRELYKFDNDEFLILLRSINR